MAQGEENECEKCRICLSCDTSIKYLSLFEKYTDCFISDKVSTIANVEIKKGDGLPDRICPDCLLELDNALKFKQKCEDSNKILRSTVTTNVNREVVIKEEKYSQYISSLDLDYLESSVLYEDCIKQEETIIVDPTNKTIKSRAVDLKLECHDCGELFKSKCKLRVHWRKVHQNSQLVCDKCKRQFKSFKAYSLHNKKNLKSCKTASLVNIEGLGKTRLFHCKDCEYKTKRIKDMEAHLVLHTGDRPFVCNFCHKGFTQQSSLQAHQESAHKEYMVETTCQFCGKHIKGRTKLYKHLRQHRPLQAQCEVCKKIFKSKQYLKQHVKRHSNVKGYSCEACAASFYTASDLANHKRTTHNKSKRFKCDICDYLAYRAEIIKRHRAKHSATNIPCLICGIFSQNQDEFLMHQKRHLDKKHQCPHCDSRFYGRKNLSRHIRVKHKCTMLVSKHIVNPITVKEESLNSGQYEVEISQVTI